MLVPKVIRDHKVRKVHLELVEVLDQRGLKVFLVILDHKVKLVYEVDKVLKV